MTVSARNVSKAEIQAAIRLSLEPIEKRLAAVDAAQRSAVSKRDQLQQLAEQLVALDEHLAKSQGRTSVRKAYPNASLAEQIQKIGGQGAGRSKWASVL